MKYSAYLLVLLATTAQAEVYKSINADGEVIYSDIPSQGAKPVQMPALLRMVSSVRGLVRKNTL